MKKTLFLLYYYNITITMEFLFLDGLSSTVISSRTAEICFDIKMVSKEYVFIYTKRMSPFLGFWRVGTCPSDPSGVVALMRNRGGSA